MEMLHAMRGVELFESVGRTDVGLRKRR
jgi:hypothetical protein